MVLMAHFGLIESSSSVLRMTSLAIIHSIFISTGQIIGNGAGKTPLALLLVLVRCYTRGDRNFACSVANQIWQLVLYDSDSYTDGAVAIKQLNGNVGGSR